MSKHVNQIQSASRHNGNENVSQPDTSNLWRRAGLLLLIAAVLIGATLWVGAVTGHTEIATELIQEVEPAAISPDIDSSQWADWEPYANLGVPGLNAETIESKYPDWEPFSHLGVPGLTEKAQAGSR